MYFLYCVSSLMWPILTLVVVTSYMSLQMQLGTCYGRAYHVILHHNTADRAGGVYTGAAVCHKHT